VLGDPRSAASTCCSGSTLASVTCRRIASADLEFWTGNPNQTVVSDAAKRQIPPVAVRQTVQCPETRDKVHGMDSYDSALVKSSPILQANAVVGIVEGRHDHGLVRNIKLA